MSKPNYFFFALLILTSIAFACSNPNDSSAIIQNKYILKSEANTSLPNKSLIYDGFDVISVNTFSFRNITFYNKLDTLLKKIGKPDSIINPNYECGYYGDVSAIVYYYKGFNFNVYKNNADIDEINFVVSNIEIKYNYGSFSSETTIDEIATRFPHSYGKALKESSSRNNKDIAIRLSVEESEDFFIDLTFKNGKLISLSTLGDC